MIKLGVHTDEKEASLKKQGYLLASIKLRDELGSCYLEEATFPHLSGQEYALIRDKIAFILKRLKKIGYKLKDHDIQSIREYKYQEMYSILKEELLQLRTLVEIHPHVSYTRRLKHVRTILDRITEEFNILDPGLNQVNIKEPNFATIHEAA